MISGHDRDVLVSAITAVEDRLGRDLAVEPLRATDFPAEGVRINFHDGSFVEFNCAFFVKYWVGRTAYIAVFTEHCGFHAFAVTGIKSILTAATWRRTPETLKVQMSGPPSIG